MMSSIYVWWSWNKIPNCQKKNQFSWRNENFVVKLEDTINFMINIFDNLRHLSFYKNFNNFFFLNERFHSYIWNCYTKKFIIILLHVDVC